MKAYKARDLNIIHQERLSKWTHQLGTLQGVRQNEGSTVYTRVALRLLPPILLLLLLLVLLERD